MKVAGWMKGFSTIVVAAFLLNGCGGGGGGNTSVDSSTNTDTSPYAAVITPDNALEIVRAVFQVSGKLKNHYGLPQRPTMIFTGTSACPVSGTYTVEYSDSLNTYFNQCVSTAFYSADTQDYANGHNNWTITEESGSPWRYTGSWTTNAVFDTDLDERLTGVIMQPTSDGGMAPAGTGQESRKTVGIAQFSGSYDSITDRWVENYSGSSFYTSQVVDISKYDGQQFVVNTSAEMLGYNLNNTEIVTSTGTYISFKKDRDFTLVLKDNQNNLSATYTVVTEPVFSGSGRASTSMPYQGAMTITGAENTKVTVTANSDQTVTLLVNNGVSILLAWSDIISYDW